MSDNGNVPTKRIHPVLLYAGVFLLAFVLLVFRRVSAFTMPQFYGEDGIKWYLDAHDLGVRAWLIPHGGYIQLFPRVVGSLAQLVPMVLAPLLFSLVALVVLSGASVFVLTDRFNEVLPNLWGRAAVAVFILLTPSMGDMHGTLTNSHYVLSLMAALILLVATPDKRIGWRIFDVVLILLSGLSNPFCILLTPLVWVRYRQYRDKHLFTLACLTTACAVLQFGMRVIVGSDRSAAPLGASVQWLIHILANRVFLNGLLGQANILSLATAIRDEYSGVGLIAPCIVVAICLFLLFRAWTQGTIGLRLFMAFAFLSLAVALASPLASINQSQWMALATLNSAGRYFWFAILAFFLALLQVAILDKNRRCRGVAIAFLALSPLGMTSDYLINPLPYMGHKAAAAVYDKSPKGTRLLIPATPTEDWAFWITK